MIKDMKFVDFPTVKSTCEEFKEKFPFCMHCRSMLVDIYTEEGNKESAIETCDSLISSDSIRSKYWTYRKNVLL